MDVNLLLKVIAPIIILLILLYYIPIGLWFRALLSGVKIDLIHLIFMRWRKVPPQLIVNALIVGAKTGIELNRAELEAYYLSGGDVQKVVDRIITEGRKGNNISFKKAMEFNNESFLIENIITKYQLQPHPEGGYYKEVYRSEREVISKQVNEARNALTHIYFLLKEGQFSRFHKVLHDEIWNFYEGSPLKIIEFNGQKVEEKIIGKENGIYASVVKAGIFQAAESTGPYTLVGCSVAPGFDFKDFSFLTDEPKALKELNNKFPDYKYLV
jgi:hypothetical protein